MRYFTPQYQLTLTSKNPQQMQKSFLFAPFRIFLHERTSSFFKFLWLRAFHSHKLQRNSGSLWPPGITPQPKLEGLGTNPNYSVLSPPECSNNENFSNGPIIITNASQHLSSRCSKPALFFM